MLPESDWKKLRVSNGVAVERFSQNVLAEVEKLLGDESVSAHERYLALYELVRERDKDMVCIFDSLSFSRSNAFMRLLYIRARGLIDDEDFARYSDDTRTRIDECLKHSQSGRSQG